MAAYAVAIETPESNLSLLIACYPKALTRRTCPDVQNFGHQIQVPNEERRDHRSFCKIWVQGIAQYCNHSSLQHWYVCHRTHDLENCVHRVHVRKAQCYLTCSSVDIFLRTSQAHKVQGRGRISKVSCYAREVDVLARYWNQDVRWRSSLDSIPSSTLLSTSPMEE